MNYEKLTLERFTENLSSGRYKNLTGARRAVGKCKSWSPKDRQKAQDISNAHFGESGTPQKSAAKKAPKAAKVVSPKADKAVAKATRTPKVIKPLKEHHKSAPVPGLAIAHADFDKIQKINHAAQLISAGAHALEALSKAKQAEPSLDITEGQEAVNLITQSVQLMATTMYPTKAPEEKVAAAAEPVHEEEEEVEVASKTDFFAATNGKKELSEEERRELDLFSRARPSAVTGPGTSM